MRTALALLLCSSALTLTAVELGKPAPALTIQGSGRPAMKLAEFRGKVVLLAFIHTTCPHCQELTKSTLVPVAREYAARGVQVVECAFNQGAGDLVGPFAQQFQTPFPVGWTDFSTVMGFLGHSPNDPKPFFVPHLVFLDRQGNIQGDYAGESDFMKTPEPNIRKELDRLLKLPGTATAHK